MVLTKSGESVWKEFLNGHVTVFAIPKALVGLAVCQELLTAIGKGGIYSKGRFGFPHLMWQWLMVN
jgi:hypothetical protein